MGDLDFDETINRTKRAKILLHEDGRAEIIGLNKKFIGDAFDEATPAAAKEAAAEFYAFFMRGYCVEHGVSKTKAQIKAAFLAQGE